MWELKPCEALVFAVRGGKENVHKNKNNYNKKV